MSRADVETLEGVYARWREGDFAEADIFHPDVEVIWSPKVLDASGVTRGVEPMASTVRHWFVGLQDVRFEVERFVDLGDRVLVIAVMHARGRDSKIEVAERYGHMWTLRDGQAIRLQDTPEPNVVIAERFMELSRLRDWSRLELLAEDVIYRPIAEITESAEYRGRDGFRRYMEDFFESEWVQDLTLDVTEVRDYGDAVIARVQLTGRGSASDLPFGARVFVVMNFRQGQIVRIEDFLDRDDAVRAAGG